MKLKAIELLWFLSLIPTIFFTISCKYDIPIFILIWIFFPFIYMELEFRLEG